MGSGLYILHYPIDSRWYVLVGGANYAPEDTPWYVYLCSYGEDGPKPRLNVMTDDLDAFLSARISSVDDPSASPNFAADTMIERFFEDALYTYSFPQSYADRVIVRYTDGTQEPLPSALASGRASIADLDRFGVEYIREEK